MARENEKTNLNQQERLRTLVVFERDALCKLWRTFLSSIPRLDILDTYPTNANLLEEIVRLKPDLILLDWNVLGENKNEMIQQVKQCLAPRKNTCIVVVNTTTQKSLVEGADRVMALSAESSENLQNYIDTLLLVG